MNKILLSILLSTLLFSATSEQVEQYLSVSYSEEQLIELEEQFSIMQNNLNSSDKNSSNTYDMQMLPIRFREYLQKNLSEDELDEIIQQYRNVLLMRFISSQNDSEYDPKLAESYVKSIEKDSDAAVRIELAEKIGEALYKKESIGILFDNLMKPLMQNSIGGTKINEESLKQSRENYIEMMKKTGRIETIYATKDFTIEELDELLKIVNTPVMEHESKAVFGATAYALKEYFLSIANRYDLSKHQR
jgi:arsenate reductase-like glutaredoxin family protein